MTVGEDNTVVNLNDTFKNGLNEMCRTSLGMVNIIDDRGKLIGVFTDGDLRRKLAQDVL